MRYDVDADLYDGPLPLFVELARLQLVDLFLVRLVALTQDYLVRIRSAHIPLNDLAEPLPLFGTLMVLKARRLLPAPPVVEEDEAPLSLEELERRLKEYEQFKTVAQLLAELHALQHRHFLHPRSSEPELTSSDQLPATERDSRPMEVGIHALVVAFTKVLEQSTASVYEVVAESWTVEKKLEELRVALMVKRQLRFSELFANALSRLELVVTFLALLELIRTRVASALQEQPFAEILIARREVGWR
jgi:segregation and condensation protein A